LAFPVVFLLLRRGWSTEVGIATVTPKSLGVKGGGELLRYHPSSRWAHLEGGKYVSLTAYVNVGKQWIPSSNGLPRDLKTTVHGRVPKD